MATRGPKPKPAILHIADGTHRRDRHGDPAAIVASPGTPERPKELAGDAKKLWDAIVPGLVESGVATERDAVELAEMCQWFKRYKKAAKECDRTAASNPYYRQLLLATKTAWGEFDGIASRFGLTPSDRARLKVEPKQKSGVATRKRG